MTNIYDQHRAAFANISAFVIVRGQERIATVAFKFPRDGAGRLYAYVHFLGMPMVRGFAGGHGYDKRSAAVEDAMRKIDPAYFDSPDWSGSRAECERFVAAVRDARDGTDWPDMFRAAGYNVWWVV